MEPAARNGTLAAACESAQRLITVCDRPLQRVTVRAGDVSIDLQWPSSEARPQATAPVVAGMSATTPTPTPNVARNGAAAPEPASGPRTHHIRAEMVGVFYLAPEPGAEPFVRKGDLVRPGQQVAIIEAMKMMTPVHAERGGWVDEILVADSDPVEYGMALFALTEDGPR